MRVLPLTASVIASTSPSPSATVCEATRLTAVPLYCVSSSGSIPRCQLGPTSGSIGTHARSYAQALTSARGRGVAAISMSAGPRNPSIARERQWRPFDPAPQQSVSEVVVEMPQPVGVYRAVVDPGDLRERPVAKRSQRQK